MGKLRTAPRRLIGGVIGALRGRDLALHAAATTFYGGIAVVPVSLLTLRLAAAIVGVHRLAATAGRVAAAFPAELGANVAAGRLVAAGAHLTAGQVVAALLPATLYGEGLRRSLVSLVGGREVGREADRSAGREARRERAIGWRGRLLVLPLLAAGPGLLLALLLVLPWAAALLFRGGLLRVGAVVVSFLVVWLALSPVVIWVYRIVGPARPRWPVTVAAGSFAAANLSGFLHGFVLFWSLPLDLGLPFGGFGTVGAVVAVALWLYVFHVVVLVGYVFTLQLDRLVGPRGRPMP